MKMFTGLSVLAVAFLLALPGEVTGGEPESFRATPCGGCHPEAAVDPGLTGSVHQDLFCSDCHFEYLSGDHLRDKKVSGVKGADICRRCHLEHFMHRFDDIHPERYKREDLPGCLQCHGGHDVAEAAEAMKDITARCTGCHPEVFAMYRESVHGKSMLQHGDGEAAMCPACHRSHSGADLSASSSEVCGKCHSDRIMMAGHGLNVGVERNYLSLYHRQGTADPGERETHPCLIGPGCTDCHGNHNITKVDDVFPGKMKDRLARNCQGCHEVRGADIPVHWLPHYIPAWGKAWLVMAVTGFYRGLVGLMGAGFILNVFVHAWRYLVGR